MINEAFVASLIDGGALYEHYNFRLLCRLLDVASLIDGGAKRDRTADLLLARQALSQLSYSPMIFRGKMEWWA